MWIALFFLVTCGCSSVKNPGPVSIPNFAPAPVEGTLQQGDYVLQSGDVIDIKFFYNTELNERIIIRPDGKISLQLIDDVKAAGLTAHELDTLLKEKYRDILQTPEIRTIVQQFSAQKVYVGGEVNNPGILPLSANLTTIRAIFGAGGFKNTASLDTVVVIREQQNQQPLFLTLNLKAGLDSKDMTNDIELKPFDVVYVPKTLIAKMDLFMEQYFEKLIPISKNLGFGWVYNLGKNH